MSVLSAVLATVVKHEAANVDAFLALLVTIKPHEAQILTNYIGVGRLLVHLGLEIEIDTCFELLVLGVDLQITHLDDAQGGDDKEQDGDQYVQEDIEAPFEI